MYNESIMKEISQEQFAVIARHFRSSGQYLSSDITTLSGFILIRGENRSYLIRGTDFILRVSYKEDSAEMVCSEFIKGSMKDIACFF